MAQLQSLHEEVTNRVISLLEQNQRAWIYTSDQRGGSFLPYNLVTHGDYSGINTIVLWLAAQEKGYGDQGWITLKQATREGYRVIKGEKGIACFYFKLDAFKDEETGEMVQVPIHKTFMAFNVDQLCKKKPEATFKKGGKTEKKESVEIHPIEQCKLLIQAANATVRPVQNTKIVDYLAQKDVIDVPDKANFKTEENYYATFLNGLVSWTGHEDRLNRFSKLNGTIEEKKIFELLVADIGTGFLCAKFKLNGKWLVTDQQKEQWLNLLRSDPQTIFRAASLANKAYKYLMCLVENATGHDSENNDACDAEEL